MNLFLFSLLIGISWVEMQVGRAVAYHCLSSWTFNSNPSLRPSLRSLFRASTWWPLSLSFRRGYFDPRGSHEPRQFDSGSWRFKQYFDPRGSREPRPLRYQLQPRSVRFRSTRLSRASTVNPVKTIKVRGISIHEALASLDDIKKL